MNRVFQVACTFALLLRASVACAGEYSDAAGTFTLSVGERWKSAEKIPAPIVLMLQGKPTPPSTVTPIVTAVTPPDNGRAPLQLIAEETVNAAKETIPDQKGLGEIKVTTVDGEDAREATFLLKTAAARVKVKCALVRHGGKFYVFQVIAGEDAFDKLAAELDAVLASIKWKH